MGCFKNRGRESTPKNGLLCNLTCDGQSSPGRKFRSHDLRGAALVAEATDGCQEELAFAPVVLGSGL